MDKTTKAARASGKTHGIRVADLCASQVTAGGVPDTDEAYVTLLACHIGCTARELAGRGMADHLVQIWMEAAVKAGVARLREFSHFINQPKRNEH